MGTTLKQRLRRFNGTDYDTIHLETEKSCITDFPTTMTPTAHNHAAGDINSGTLLVSRGGTGLDTLTSGSFLKGNGTNAVTLRTPSQVLSDIGAAASSHTHPNIGAVSAAIPADADLNTYTTAGFYTATTTSSKTIANIPSEAYNKEFYLIVQARTSKYLMQRVIMPSTYFGTPSEVSTIEYRRYDTNGTWSDWETIQTAQALTSDVSYYCYGTNGSDSNPGTIAAPFASFSKAISMIPKNLNGHTATIFLMETYYDQYLDQHRVNLEGTYTLTINGYYGGTINIYAMTTDKTDYAYLRFPETTTKLTSAINISYCDAVINIRAKHFNFHNTNNDDTTTCSGIVVSYSKFVILGIGAFSVGTNLAPTNDPPYYAVYAFGGSNVEFHPTSNADDGYITIHGGFERVINCQYLSHVVIMPHIKAGGTSNYGLVAGGGSFICSRYDIPAGLVTNSSRLYSPSGGSRIYVGDQTAVPNY